MSQPLVSIITPCYNGQPFLQRVLDSVKASTYGAIEHIIVDDASSDESRSTLESLGDRYTFELLTSNTRQGPGPARNRGAASAQGKYLLFLDCDDTIEPDFLNILVARAEAEPHQSDPGQPEPRQPTKIAPFYTPIQLHGAMDRVLGGSPWSIERLVDSPFMNVCSLIPRAAFDEVGGFTPQLRVLEDYDLFLKLAFAGYRGQLVTETLLHCEIRYSSYSDHFNQRGGDRVKRRTRRAILQSHRSAIERLGLADRPKVWPYLNGKEGDAGEFDLSRVTPAPRPETANQTPDDRSTPPHTSPNTLQPEPATESNDSSDETAASEPSLHYPENPVLVEAREKIEVELIADLLVSLIPGDARRVLEVGCGTGSMGEQFKRVVPRCHYTGIALSEAEAQQAATRLDRAIAWELADLSRADLRADLDLEPGSLDCIVYRLGVSDSLYFEAIVAQQAALLRPEGVMLLAQPNPRHWSAIVELLAGRSCPSSYDLLAIPPLLRQHGLTMLDVRPLDRQDEPPDAFTHWLHNPDLLEAAAREFSFDAELLKSTSRISHYIFRAWNAPQMPPLLLVQTLLISTMASDRVRVYQPDRLLQTIPGARTVSSVKALVLMSGRPQERQVFIWQRARLEPDSAIEWQRRLVQRGNLIVAEIDDDPRFWPENIESDFFTYRACHCIQTSTEPLAEFLRQFNPHVKVVPNQLPELPPPRTYDDAAPVMIFFGALNREPDWQPLMAGINRTLNDFGDRVHMCVVHDRRFYHALETPHKSFEATCTYDRYHEILRECDVALLPLNPTEFNGMKSDLKFIECAGRGVVTLVSPTVYTGSVDHGKTGLMFHSPEEFEVLLHQVIENDDWRREIAANAYAYVREQRLISHHYRDRYDWYLEMLDRLPELNAALRDRVPAIFEGLDS